MWFKFEKNKLPYLFEIERILTENVFMHMVVKVKKKWNRRKRIYSQCLEFVFFKFKDKMFIFLGFKYYE